MTVKAVVCLGQVLIDLVKLGIALFARLVQIRFDEITLKVFINFYRNKEDRKKKNL